MDASVFDEDYFMNGIETKKSLYVSYSWKPELTIPMAQAIVDYVGIGKGETVLDFGCARGYLVKALRQLGHQAFGVDCSEWAIENCDPEVKDFVGLGHITASPLKHFSQWIIAKDVLEHVADLSMNIGNLLACVQKGVFAVVPLSEFPGGKYVVREYEADVTHIHRLPLWNWAKLFMRPGWSVEGCYRVKGVKDNYSQFETGNGFITARRI